MDSFRRAGGFDPPAPRDHPSTMADCPCGYAGGRSLASATLPGSREADCSVYIRKQLVHHVVILCNQRDRFSLNGRVARVVDFVKLAEVGQVTCNERIALQPSGHRTLVEAHEIVIVRFLPRWPRVI